MTVKLDKETKDFYRQSKFFSECKRITRTSIGINGYLNCLCKHTERKKVRASIR